MASLIAFALLAGGCAAMARSEAKRKENLFIAAGWQMKVADTPQKQATLQGLQPSRKILIRQKDGQPLYTFADPEGCNCMYVGTPAQYGEYRRLALQQQVAQDQVDAAMANESAAMDWGMWGPWGPW